MGQETEREGRWESRVDRRSQGEEQHREEIRRHRRIKQRKRMFRRRICFLLVVGLAVGGVLGLLHVMNQNNPSKEAPAVSEINGIPVVQSILPKGIPGRPGTGKKIRCIVIHETGNEGKNANAASHANYLQNEAAVNTLSWHYTVDDKEIYHHVPDNEIAFHAGDGLDAGGGNASGIGIELCVNPEGDYEKTLQNAAGLTAKLMKDYNLKIEDVKKHQDFSGKNCPEVLIADGRWEEFLDMVEKMTQGE